MTLSSMKFVVAVLSFEHVIFSSHGSFSLDDETELLELEDEDEEELLLSLRCLSLDTSMDLSSNIKLFPSSSLSSLSFSRVSFESSWFEIGSNVEIKSLDSLLSLGCSSALIYKRDCQISNKYEYFLTDIHSTKFPFNLKGSKTSKYINVH